MLDRLWDALIRWRTWAVNTALIALIVLPDLLSAPEVLAIIPAQYQRYALAAALLLNIVMRPRAAVRAGDTEAKRPGK